MNSNDKFRFFMPVIAPIGQRIEKYMELNESAKDQKFTNLLVDPITLVRMCITIDICYQSTSTSFIMLRHGRQTIFYLQLFKNKFEFFKITFIFVFYSMPINGF